MRFTPLFAAVAAASVVVTAAVRRENERSTLQLTSLYKFPSSLSGSNLVQAKDGSILVTTQGGPHVYRIDHSGGQLVATFPGHQNTFSIIELEDNVFYINAANYTHAPTWNGIQGSNTLYRLNLSDAAAGPATSQITSIPQARTLDGMAVQSKARGMILAGDTQTGVLYLIDTRRGTSCAVFQSELLNMTAASSAELDHVGINGVEIQSDSLFFTNTARHSFGRMMLSEDGLPKGPIELLLPNLPLPDDFAVDGRNVVLTELQHGLLVYRLGRPASEQQSLPLVAHLPGANAVEFGRADSHDYCTLYALYNKKIVNGTGSGLVKASLIGKGLRQGC